MPSRALPVVPLVCLSATALAQPASMPEGGAALLCRPAIEAAARAHGIPPGLMTAIGRVESGRHDPITGAWYPWPWTVDADGQGYFLNSKAEAIMLVQRLQGRGVRSIDVGCMQVNLMHHPNAFPTLDAAFDPASNADYAARFLTQLYAQTRAWPEAAGRYHSSTPELETAYQRKVMALWPEEQMSVATAPPGSAPGASGAALGHARAATMAGGFPPPVRGIQGGHIIRQVASPGRPLPPGRDLSSYRALPILLATRPVPRPGG
jgi:hypothetical protein